MDNLDDLIPFSDAGECKPRLRRMLARGGLARWFDGKQTRVLDSSGGVQAIPLPWPLSVIQPRFIQLRIYNGEDIVATPPVFEHTYKKSEMEPAMDQFLRGAAPTDSVQFTEF